MGNRLGCIPRRALAELSTLGFRLRVRWRQRRDDRCVEQMPQVEASPCSVDLELANCPGNLRHIGLRRIQILRMMHVERDRGAERHGVDARTSRELLGKDLPDEVGNLTLCRELLVRLPEALELVGKLLSRGEAIAGLFCESLLKDLVELVGHIGQSLFERRHRIHDHGPHRRGLGLPTVERPPGERLEQTDAQREDIQAMVSLTCRALFGRHVRELALDHAGLGLVRTVVSFRNAEIEQLHGAGVADHDVMR